MTTTFDLSPEEHRRLGSALFNQVWTQLETEVRTQEQDERMLHMAHASRFHWGESQPPPENLARGEWQVSRVYAVLGRAEPALHHATRCLEICEANAIGDFDLAYAHEAMARAYAVGSDEAGARRHSALARDAGTRIGEDEDRELFEADLATLPVG